MTYTIEQIKELCENVIVGPWELKTGDGRKNRRIESSADIFSTDYGKIISSVNIVAWKQGQRDAGPTAKFIAASRTIIPELVAEVEFLKKQLKEARAVIEKYSENRMMIEMSPLNQTIDTTLDAREWLNKWGEK